MFRRRGFETRARESDAPQGLRVSVQVEGYVLACATMAYIIYHIGLYLRLPTIPKLKYLL